MIGEEQRAALDASFRMAREPAIDGLATILGNHPPPRGPRSWHDLRTLSEGAIVGLHGMFVRDVVVPRFVEDIGRFLFGVTDGADETLVVLTTYLETNLRASIPSEIRDQFDERIARLCMRLMLGWIQRREQLDVGDIARTLDPVESTPDVGRIVQAAVDQSPFGIYITDFRSAAPIVNNDAHQHMFGYSEAEERRLEPERFQDQDMADGDFDLLADLIDGRIPFLERISSRPHKDGRSVPYHLLAWPVRDEAGEISHLFSLISPEARSEATSGSGLAEKRARYLLRLSPDPVVITTAEGEIRYASPSVGSVLGYDPDSLVGAAIDILFAPASAVAGRRMLDVVAGGFLTRTVAEVEVVLQDGTTRWFEIVATNLLRVDDVQGVVLQGRDVTERRALQEELERAALSDPLTGLLNRRGYLQRLQAWLDQHDTGHSRRASLVGYIDLDAFKAINDRFGHEAGDAVLVAIGERLATLLGPQGFAGRIGGDEFVLLADLPDEFARVQFQENLALALTGTITLGEEEIRFAGSAGLVSTSKDAELALDAAGLLRRADERLTRSKIEKRHASVDNPRGLG